MLKRILIYIKQGVEEVSKRSRSTYLVDRYLLITFPRADQYPLYIQSIINLNADWVNVLICRIGKLGLQGGWVFEFSFNSMKTFYISSFFVAIKKYLSEFCVKLDSNIPKIVEEAKSKRANVKQ